MLIQIQAPPLHPKQNEVFKHPARFRTVVAGRRWGKSHLAGGVCLDALLNKGQNVWWVSPTFDISKRVGWRTIETALRPLIRAGYATANKSDLTIEIANGARFQAKSADDPSKLVGEGLDLAVLDEAGIIRPMTWFESIRPTLSDRLGRALFIGTPKGINWFFDLYGRGLDPQQQEYASWRFSTVDNPYILPSEIDSARASLPENTFKQEYLAEFVEDGSLFRGIHQICILPPRAPYSGRFVFGVDFAQVEDFTVISIIDMDTRQQVYLERFNRASWQLQRQRIEHLYKLWQPKQIIAEVNSIGSVNIEALQSAGVPIHPFTTTNQSKRQIIDSLALAIEQKTIALLNDPVQINELASYQMERLPGGGWRYTAPNGMHDDTVMALALAWHGIANQMTMPIFM